MLIACNSNLLVHEALQMMSLWVRTQTPHVSDDEQRLLVLNTLHGMKLIELTQLRNTDNADHCIDGPVPMPYCPSKPQKGNHQVLTVVFCDACQVPEHPHALAALED